VQSFYSALFFWPQFIMIPETIFLPKTDSTNRVAFSMAGKGAVHGSAVIADKQEKGRGRLGRNWQSPAGKGLYCSIIVRPRISVDDFPLITMGAGLGVVLAIESVCGLNFGLKWPNDIFRRGKKCGGILVESSPLTHGSDHFAIVGIGINVDTGGNDFPADIRHKATSLLIECDNTIEKQSLFEAIRMQLLEQLQRLEKDGFGPILKQWRQKDVFAGKRLQCVARTGELVDGISLGPDERGRLHIRDDNGAIHEVLSGDVNLVR